jgi:hypothetical protein
LYCAGIELATFGAIGVIQTTAPIGRQITSIQSPINGAYPLLIITQH